MWINNEDPCWSQICGPFRKAWNVGILRLLPSGVVADAVTDGTFVLREVVEPSTQIFALLENRWFPKNFRMTRWIPLVVQHGCGMGQFRKN